MSLNGGAEAEPECSPDFDFPPRGSRPDTSDNSDRKVRKEFVFASNFTGSFDCVVLATRHFRVGDRNGVPGQGQDVVAT